MSEVFTRIREAGIVPVIRLERSEDALPLGAALLEAGLPIAEVTFRSAAAPQAIRLLRREHPSLLVGAGTVLGLDQLEAAIDSGAAFVVTPGFNPRIVDACMARGMPIVPGINSPSQVELALERGLRLLKFFPAEASGGVKMLKALHGPYPDAQFVPTGGIDVSNLLSYLSLAFVAAAGGSWMVNEELIAAGSWREVARLSAEAVAMVRSTRK